MVSQPFCPASCNGCVVCDPLPEDEQRGELHWFSQNITQGATAVYAAIRDARGTPPPDFKP